MTWIVAGVYVVDPERAHPGHLCHIFSRLRPMEVRRVPRQYDNRPWRIRLKFPGVEAIKIDLPASPGFGKAYKSVKSSRASP